MVRDCGFLVECDRFARQLPLGSQAVLVGHPSIGRIGRCEPGRGFVPHGMTSRSIDALLRDEVSARKALRERGAITSWDGVLNARANGKSDDFMGYKGSQTTVANNWSSFARSTGVPGAVTYGTIPGGETRNNASVGAWPISTPAAGDRKYLLNFGVQHASGTNIVLLADLLLTASGIDANSAAAQTINSAPLTRYTDGAGVMMTLEVITALGASAANVTVTYTNSAGAGSRSTGAIAMTTSCITYRLQPTSGGAMIPLAAGDLGVRSIQTLQFSGAMGGGIVALLLYKPLLIVPTIATTTYVERSTPGMLSGIIELVKEAGGALGCLVPFVLASTTSTGIQNYFTQCCAG